MSRLPSCVLANYHHVDFKYCIIGNVKQTKCVPNHGKCKTVKGSFSADFCTKIVAISLMGVIWYGL